MRFLNTRGHRSAASILALSALAFAMPIAANAQWTVTNLHPSGATASRANSVDDGKQGGYAVIGGVQRASLWNGSAGSRVDLHPAGATGSGIWVVQDGQQVGSASGHAGWWSGTAASFVDMHPAGFDFSGCFGAGGGMQVGYAGIDLGAPPHLFHAGMWFNTANSWVDLHPDWPGLTESRAVGGDAVVQVGYVFIDGVMHASRWNGSAASWVDLHPAGATSSLLSGGGAGQQVGAVALVGIGGHAALWNDTLAWIDLHPAGAYSGSGAYEAFDNQQVGYASYNGAGPSVFHAFIWSGSASTGVDLHNFLPRNKYSFSMAYDIWHNATYTYVVGFAHNIAANREEAFMWRRRR